MPAARCTICAASFPAELAGGKCPICEEETLAGISNDMPDPVEELNSRVSNARFERYYERTRGVHPDAA